MLIEKEKPNYYSIIPANVRYNNNLKPNEKLLYGEITALTQKNGICYANNEYFANLYNVSKVAVSNWISNLEKEGFITREIIYKEGTKQILNRFIRLYPIKENFNTYTTKVYDPIKENFNTPIKENFKDNNTSINNTSNNKEKTNKKKIEEIFNYWNSKKIIVHDKITATIENAINKFIKNNSLELTKLCIDRYSEVLKDDNYFFKYKWTLSDFLNRKTGAVEFLDGGSKWQSYLFKTTNKNTQIKKTESYEEER